MNPDVNPDAPVQVVQVQPRFSGWNPLILRKRFPQEVKDAVLATFRLGVANEETGLVVGMSGGDFNEHLKFYDDSTGLAHLEAIAALPDLMSKARRIEIHPDKKPEQNSSIKQVHRFISAFSVNTKNYAVLLTVKELVDGSMRLDTENPVRLYHHRMEKEMPAGISNALPTEWAGDQPSAGTMSYSIRQLLTGVKDSMGKGYEFAEQEQRRAEPKKRFRPRPR